MEVVKSVDLDKTELMEAFYNYLRSKGVQISNRDIKIKMVNGAQVLPSSFVKLRIVWVEDE